ncbi:MAG: autotransporter outer membrane beta-barrel domain-containing protein [Alphaproteobacteria bacterium]
MTVTQLFKRTALGIAILAASAFSASAQYDEPAGEVVGAQISQQVTSQVASTLASGIGGGGFTGDAGGGGLFGPSGTSTSALPVTRYFEGGNRGRSAGAGEKKMGVWLLGSYSDIENDFINTAFDGDVAAFVGGVDYRLTERVVAGVALSYEDVDIDTTFNTGTIETSGVGVAPYAVFKLTKNISADVNGSYTRLDTDTTRTNGTVTGQFDARRYTAGGNLNIGHSVNKVFMNGSVGFLYINESQDSYTESNGTFVGENDISIGQGRLGGTVGYDFGKVQPFLTAQVQHEFWAPSTPVLGGGLASPSEDTTGYVVGGGVNFDISDSVSGTLTATSTEGRDDLSLYSVSGRVRVKF